MIEAVILVVFPFAMLHAAISDMLSMTIINRVSLLLIVAFLLVAPATGMIGLRYLAAHCRFCRRRLPFASRFLRSVPWAAATPN